jgi:AcrR family transcriptional regulator
MPIAATRKSPSRVAGSRRGRDRRAEIINAARDVFLERGYAGASTDEIVARSGGSKETLYSHFGNKLGLFREVLVREIELLFENVHARPDEAPLERLRGAARSFVRQSMRPEAIALMRILIAEGVRLPELTTQLHDIVEEKIGRVFAQLIAAVQETGEMTGEPAHVLADILNDLLRGGTILRVLFEPELTFSSRKLDAYTDVCLERLRKVAR